MMNRLGMLTRRRALLAASAALALIPGAALAQEARGAASTTTTPPPASAGQVTGEPTDQTTPATQGEDIIVTGTSIARAAFDTPLAVTSVSQQRLQRLSSSSQADILNTIPTIKADAGGGEVATNVFIRGLPSGGQYQFTPLEYDGIPVFSTFGLNSSAYDVLFRNDQGIERLEFVRGGVSNLFGPGSVAGLINYISRTGSDVTHGTYQLEVAERGRMRADAALSGRLGNNLYGAISGYYRYDAGPIRTGLDTDGYQLRGNLKYEFESGGSLTLFGQWIDDQVQYYLPIPLNGTTRDRIRGNDGRIVNSVQGPEIGRLSFQSPDGRYRTLINESVLTKGGQIALALDKDLGGGWSINGRAKYSQYAHRFGLYSDGDGVINVPETLQSFLTNRNLGSTANASFTFADNGAAVPANYLMFANRATDRDRPATDYTGELNLTKEVTTGALKHNFTLGGFYGNANALDYNVTTTYLAEFNNQPRLIDVTVRNPTTGATTVISQGGVLNAGSGYVNNRHKAQRYAGYFADQIDAGRFQFDIGGRVEHLDGDIRRERTSTYITDSTTPNLSTALRDVTWGNDTYQTAQIGTTAWAVSADALYKITRNLNIYANASRGYFFPELRSVTFNALGQAASYEPEVIKQAEVGLKVDTRLFSGTLAGLYTKLDNRRQVLFINGTGGSLIESVNIVGTESYGMEATGSVRLFRSFRIDGNVTLQHHEYTAYDTAPGNIGNKLERQPNLLFNVGGYYDDGTFDLSLFTNYTGDNYTAANNAILLDGFYIANLDAGVKVKLSGTPVRLSVNVFNLLDTQATTEGSPRQDASQTAGGAYFVGRPVLPRRITGRVTVNF